jgi:hypothetical protein
MDEDVDYLKDCLKLSAASTAISEQSWEGIYENHRI